MSEAWNVLKKGSKKAGSCLLKLLKGVYGLLSKGFQCLFLAMVKFYQTFISPMHPPCCRYYPTCSQYAVEAIQKYGPIKGTAMALWRVLRCNPWSKGGYDPVK